MNYTNLDLDVYGLIKDLPEENSVFYFRAGVEGQKDFFYAKGNLGELGEVLAGLMKQNEDLEQMVFHAIDIFTE